MKLRIDIIKDSVVTNSNIVNSTEEKDAWISAASSGFPDGYTVQETDITAQEAQKEVNEQSLKYLASTDWYVIRKAETSVDVPAEILTLRAAARLAIVN